MTPTYSTRLFTYDATRNWFIGEASTLSATGQPLFGPAYSDAADQGLHLLSHVTGHATTWVVHETRRNVDNDIEVWVLKPTQDSKRRCPGLACTEVHILND